MELKKAIEDRRSIRKYTDKLVSDSDIVEFLDVARLAPSGNNAQPWHFYVVKNPEVITRLKNAEIIRDQFVYKAPVIVVCATNPDSYKAPVPGWDLPNDLRARRDLDLAAEHLVLRATDLGLGTCYCGWIKQEEIKGVLDIPREFIVPYVIAVGHPAENPSARPRKTLGEMSTIL
jgi:nitroreductase